MSNNNNLVEEDYEDGGPRCPKCGAYSGDDWSQCRRRCPMEGSPWFDADTAAKYADPFPPDCTIPVKLI